MLPRTRQLLLWEFSYYHPKTGSRPKTPPSPDLILCVLSSRCLAWKQLLPASPGLSSEDNLHREKTGSNNSTIKFPWCMHLWQQKIDSGNDSISGVYI